ncbi:unnamed protein product [Acanthoscelides obtectus]|uniref:Uncharacterized protein n=1 Tax=Acanthoscelides obtectus TaxID=200917 RepID=A0A9P0LKI3_ACAOB|nr:unnamed protein product [Acanthoscelides obtectus]CAK1682236.1 hypothetical protein AOBTE_LOCUS33504 [Acanthoscelides obtectus]
MCPRPKPAETKPCNTKSSIVDIDQPHIDMSNSTFIQYDNKKISLRIGELRSSEQSKDVLKFPRIQGGRVSSKFHGHFQIWITVEE